MKGLRSGWRRYVFFAVLSAGVCFSTYYSLAASEAPSSPFKLASSLTLAAFPLVFAFLAALIVVNRPGNPIGWLLMIQAVLGVLALPVDNYLAAFSSPPSNPGFVFLLMLWFSGWAWLLLIFPLLLILLLFPTGKTIPGLWRFAPRAVVGMGIFFFFCITFSASFVHNALNGWVVENPIGFLSPERVEAWINIWALGLSGLTLISVLSIFVRYRKAAAVEREQIKWLLYACGIFGLVFLLGDFLNMADGEGLVYEIWDLLFYLSILGIPVSIAIAILKHRLWDIDVLIRRTLVYSLLTASLGLVYLGGVTLLQNLFSSTSGQTSALSIVLSTLGIAALFSPLRRRIQKFIDQRFYRQKYDAEQWLAEFSAVARSESDLKRITDEFLWVVGETLQPEHVVLWLCSGKLNQRT
jgi:hypothetical protein